jgi:uncharacterized membrane protein
VGGFDQFCGKCGARQAGAGPRPPDFGARAQHFVNGLSNRNAALLCYIPWVGWIAAIIVLAADRFRHDRQTRFHAFQGLYLFVTWMIVDWVLVPALSFERYAWGFPFVATPARLAQLVILGTWIFMIVKVSHGQDYHLPILGEMAERSASEQRT